MTTKTDSELLHALKIAHAALLKIAESYPDQEDLQSPMVYSEGDHGKRIDVFKVIETAIRNAR